MYSLSSQVFEGITQYILKEDVSMHGEGQAQKGQLLSGQFMADMLFQRNAKSEMRYLHDFAYNLFEAELVSRKLLFESVKETNITELKDKSFIKVKGKIIFEDYEKILYTLQHFNEIGRAIGELSMQNEIQSLKESASEMKKQTNDREKKNKIGQIEKSTRKQVDRILIEQGLMIDEKDKNNVLTVMNFGYHDYYEIRLSIDGCDTLYTAIINQDNLKETEQTLISKYSRLSEKEFTIVGIVTQCGNKRAIVPSIEGNEMKKATINLIEKIDGLEEQFNGRTDNECIIDPIAIYTEI
jgi:hypothetical protein